MTASATCRVMPLTKVVLHIGGWAMADWHWTAGKIHQNSSFHVCFNHSKLIGQYPTCFCNNKNESHKILTYNFQVDLGDTQPT